MFNNVIGNKKLVDYLVSSVNNQRIPHAQLFVGPEGIGMLNTAIYYADYIINHNKNFEKSIEKSTSNRVIEMAHPDVHFVFPVINTEKIKKAISDDYLISFREFVLSNPFGSLKDWLDFLGLEKKQSQIGVDEIQNVLKKIALKSYEGGYKIMIIWMADKMNTSSSNKILKLLEEPPQKTVFLLITEKLEDIIPTILSRCQVIEFNRPNNAEIEAFLMENAIDSSTAKKAVHLAQGDVNKALKLAHQENDEKQFEEWFIKWVRTAYSAKGNAAAILNLIAWGEEIASYSRDVQKQFLNYCINFFRQALLANYNTKDLVYLDAGLEGFSLDKLAPFVNGANIEEIFKEISDAIYHIERNGNGKIILTDLSIKLTRLIHKK